MWIGNELGGHFGVASYQYDPETTPGGGEEPEGPDTPAEPTGYTKDIADMPEIDFLEVGLISDPYAGVYTDTGLKEFFEGNAPGTTLDTTFTAAIKFEEGASIPTAKSGCIRRTRTTRPTERNLKAKPLRPGRGIM